MALVFTGVARWSTSVSKLSQRHAWIALALIGTLAAAYFAPEPEGATEMPMRRESQVASTLPTASVPQGGGALGGAVPLPGGVVMSMGRAPELPTLQARKQDFSDMPEWKVFAALGQAAASAPLPTPVTAAGSMRVAQAASVKGMRAKDATMPLPPIPFSWLGRVQMSEGVRAFVRFQDDNLVVQSGDVVASVYRVENISADDLVVKHMPSGQIQHMTLSSNP
jgi:hypothetical protein